MTLLAPPVLRRRHGVSFIELLMVVTIVAALTGIGTIYYRGLIDEGNEERVRIDLRTLKKAIIKLESDQKVTVRPGGTYPNGGPHPYMEPPDLGVNLPYVSPAEPGGFQLDRLLDFRLITRLPRDPFGLEYQIDIPNGVLYSLGPDGVDNSGDEIEVPFKPPFEVLRATGTHDRMGVVVEFNRKVDPYSLYADVATNLPFLVNIDAGGAAQTHTTTAARQLTNPFAVLVRLKAPLDYAVADTIQVWNGGTSPVLSMDAADVENAAEPMTITSY